MLDNHDLLEQWRSADLPRRQEIIESISQSPRKVGAAFFESVLKEVTDPFCKWCALRDLGDLKAVDSTKAMLQVIQEPDVRLDSSSLHLIAAYSLGHIGSSCLTQLLALLPHVSRESKIAIVDACGEIGSPEAIPTLVSYLLGDDRQLVLWAAVSLARLGAISELTSCLTDASPERAYIIVDALSNISSVDILPSLALAAERLLAQTESRG